MTFYQTNFNKKFKIYKISNFLSKANTNEINKNLTLLNKISFLQFLIKNIKLNYFMFITFSLKLYIFFLKKQIENSKKNIKYNLRLNKSSNLLNFNSLIL
jgi:hypothetical protein